MIDAAKDAGVELFAYTSLLRADRSSQLLAREHTQTEKSWRVGELIGRPTTRLADAGRGVTTTA